MSGHLLIRADASAQAGSGHLMRCLALAQAWRADGGAVTFLSHCESDLLRQRIEASDCRFIPLEETYPNASDLQMTLATLRRLATGHSQVEACWLVIDGYHFDSGYHDAIRKEGYRLLVVDDNAHLSHYNANILLNQNICAEQMSYDCDRATKLLLGTRYVLLRPEFLAFRGRQREIAETGRKILVSLGGSDYHNFTLKVIQAIHQLDLQSLEAKIIVGPANPHLPSLRSAVASSAGNVQFVTASTEMPDLMDWADIAIAGAGVTCWELAFMGLPGLLVIQAENQRLNAEALSSAGAALSLGWAERVLPDLMRGALARLLSAPALRREMSRRGQELVDGEGIKRVMSELRKGSIVFREASADDCRLVWEWANDSEARAKSFSPDLIPWAQHVQWFASKVRNPSCLYYIAQDVAGKPVGQVRYDLNGDEAVISVSLDMKFRGAGYGSLIIQQSSRQVLDSAHLRVIHAYIKKENEASVRAFARAGYTEAAMAVVHNQQARHFILTKNGLK